MPTDLFPDARIPYGTWGSSFFPAWQTSPLAEVNIGQFAGEAMNRIMGRRRVPVSEIDYLIIGSTVPWHWKFWNAPLVASCMGHRIPGYHVEQACATGLQAVLQGAAPSTFRTCVSMHHETQSLAVSINNLSEWINLSCGGRVMISLWAVRLAASAASHE